jgi:hypothetical protein
MIVLSTTSDIIRVVTSAALALDVHVSFVDNTASSYTPGRQNTAIVTAATTTVAPAPAASTQRGLKEISAVARGGANTVTVEYFDGSVAYRLASVALAAGERLEYEDANGWRVIASDGALKTIGAVGATGATGATGAPGPDLVGDLNTLWIRETFTAAAALNGAAGHPLVTIASSGTGLADTGHASGDATSPGVYQLTALNATASGSTALFLGANVPSVPCSSQCRYFRGLLTTGPNIAGLSYMALGLSTMVTIADTAAFATTGAFFEYNAAGAVSALNWTTNTGAGTLTTKDSGVPFTASTTYLFEAINTSGTTWKFYINGTLVGTHTSPDNLPGTTPVIHAAKARITAGGGGTNRVLSFRELALKVIRTVTGTTDPY